MDFLTEMKEIEKVISLVEEKLPSGWEYYDSMKSYIKNYDKEVFASVHFGNV